MNGYNTGARLVVVILLALATREKAGAAGGELRQLPIFGRRFELPADAERIELWALELTSDQAVAIRTEGDDMPYEGIYLREHVVERVHEPLPLVALTIRYRAVSEKTSESASSYSEVVTYFRQNEFPSSASSLLERLRSGDTLKGPDIARIVSSHLQRKQRIEKHVDYEKSVLCDDSPEGIYIRGGKDQIAYYEVAVTSWEITVRAN
jgi:hypothetical protein